MEAHIIYHPDIKKDLKKLPSNIKERVRNVLERLKLNPLLGIPLKGDMQGGRKIRLGNYRVIYKFYPEDKTVFITKIESRQGVYKN